jgi:hypothetical protein
MKESSIKDFMDDIFEMSKNTVVVEGSIDISSIDYNSHKTYYTKDVPWFWVVMGNPYESLIEESLKNSNWEVETDGHYKFRAVLKYEPPEYDGYGRTTMNDYYEISYIDLVFEETFIQRKRNEILNQDDISDLFFNI